MRRIGWLVVVALAVVGCSDTKSQPKPEVSTQRLEIPSERIAVTTADVVSPAHPVAPLDRGVRGQVLDAVRGIFTATVADPLVKGKAGEIAPLFVPEALASATGVDRAVVYDENLGTVDVLRVTKGDVQLRALETEGGAPGLVVATIDWQLVSGDGRLAVHRVGDITLVTRDDRWQVESYALVVSRTVGDATTTTAARSK